MNPTLTYADEAVGAAPAAHSFAVRRSQEMPSYYELALEDDQGDFAHWVIPLPPQQLAKRPVLLWQLADSPMLASLTCLETGALRLASTLPGCTPTLRSELAEGVLRLRFDGRLLRGYYRLQCLPTGCGQLWQLTPIGNQ
ncbi:hypothetical protein GCM10023172_17610 [Hymenobacter ginsengisoli]|uniref:Uncharacterized protein n=1 Tax=Hymenobacter ginsengisoli TaxID=1051626 RepID=A0ABP8QBF8_9BACT|nr:MULTISPECIES: hypothetical protein [unclassified Hymenobacter]MBO2030696.1 hypothetical protein [Hymenobacter sp. BT559]